MAGRSLKRHSKISRVSLGFTWFSFSTRDFRLPETQAQRPVQGFWVFGRREFGEELYYCRELAVCRVFYRGRAFVYAVPKHMKGFFRPYTILNTSKGFSVLKYDQLRRLSGSRVMDELIEKVLPPVSGVGLSSLI